MFFVIQVFMFFCVCYWPSGCGLHTLIKKRVELFFFLSLLLVTVVIIVIITIIVSIINIIITLLLAVNYKKFTINKAHVKIFCDIKTMEFE